MVIASKDNELPDVGVKAIAEVAVAGLFKVRLILGEDERKRFLPGEVAEQMGCDARAARARARRAFFKGGCMMNLPSAGGAQRAFAVDLKYLPAFLLGFDESRCRQEVRAHLGELKDELGTPTKGPAQRSVNFLEQTGGAS